MINKIIKVQRGTKEINRLRTTNQTLRIEKCKLIKANERKQKRIDKAIEDIEFCLKSIYQEKGMSTDERTRNEMETCIHIFNKTLKTLRGEDK